MYALASTIQDCLDALVEEYDRRLQIHKDYATMPAQSRRKVARNTLSFVADWLQSSDDSQLIQFIEGRAKEQAQQGLDIGILQYAVDALEAIIEPLVTDLDTAKFVWRSLSKARDALSHQATDTLLASEKEFRQMIDRSLVGMYHTTPEGRIKYANAAFLKIVGYDSLDAINRVGESALYQDPADRQRLIEMLRQGPVTGFETELRRADGQIIAVSDSVRLVQEAGSEPYLEGILEDITEHKRVEEKSRAAHQQLSDIIDFLPDATFVIDQDRKVIAWNRAAEEMTGTRKEDILGQGDYAYAFAFWGERRPILVDFIWMEDSEFRSRYPFIQKKGNALYTEVFVPHVFGGRGAVLWAIASPLLDSEGNQVGAIESVRDVTERKQLEQQIQESLERRGRQVQTSTEVAQEIAAAPALDELFRRVVTLIKERFGYYHAQLFRYEPSQDAVVLVTGYGEAGQKMLAAGHKLAMGHGVVGTAAATGKSILATDVAQDQDWRPNPNLPDTKGELAVPIKLRDEVLGILDVQSAQAGALTAEDQLLLEGLCGQIAIAIENKRSEEALAREQYLMHVLMDNVPDLIYFKDNQSRFIRISQSQSVRFGLSDPAQAVGKSDFDFFTEEHARPAYEDEQQIIRTGQPITKEEKETWQDRPDTWVLTTKLPLRDEAGNIVGTFGISTDITNRKQAEEIIRASEAQLSEALQIAKLAYWEYDVEKDLFLFNDQFYSIFHTTAEQEGGYQISSARYAQRFVHPDDMPVVGAEIEKALASTDRHYSRRLDHRILYADGGVGYISVNINIDRDNQGRILRYYGANQDITASKLAEETLAEERNLMRTLIGTLPDMIYAKDTEGRFIMGNIGVARHMGAATPEDLVGKTDFDFYPREFAEQYYADEQAIIRLGQPIINREEPSVDAAGNPKWDLTTKVLWQDNQGKTIGLVGVSRDITERKQADAKLQETLQELERLYRATAREGWQAFRETGQIAAGYLFDRAELRPAEDIWLPQIEQAIRQNTLVPPAPSPVTTEAGRDGSVAVAPLSVRGEVIGAVGVYDDPQQPLSPEDLVLVQEIAEQGALALESARLFEQTQASLTEARVLYEASRRVSSAPSLQDMVVAVAEGIRVPVINRAVLWDLEYDTTGRPEAFTAVANWHSGQGTPPLPVGTRLPLSQFPATCLILNAEPVFMEDTECDERLDPITRAVFQPQQARAMAILPLWSSERQLGALMLVADQPHRFTDNEIRPYTSLARQMAVAIENRRLFEQTRAALEEVEATHRRYLREQWETYLREATEKAFGFVDGPAGVKAADEVWLPEMEQALEIGEPVIVAASEDQAQRGALAVPIKLRGAPIGVLEFYDENAQRTWSDNERALVETLADQAALALENARLFEDTQARAQREQLINTITARIRASTEMEAILKTTAEELSRVLNLSRARIRLHAGDGKGDPSND